MTAVLYAGLIALIAIVILAVAATALRVACGMVDVPDPGFRRAVRIIVLNGGIGTAMKFVTGLIVGGPVTGPNANPIARLILIPLCFIVSTVVYSKMLGATLGKTVQVLVIQCVMILALGLIVVFLVLPLFR